MSGLVQLKYEEVILQILLLSVISETVSSDECDPKLHIK